MAFVESRDIDKITREVHYDANFVEHIATYTKNTSDNWIMEGFINLDVHLNLLKSPFSIIICKYDNVKLIYKAINQVTVQCIDGIPQKDLFNIFKPRLSDVDLHHFINYLKRANLIFESTSNCFRTTATYENEPIFDLEAL